MSATGGRRKDVQKPRIEVAADEARQQLGSLINRAASGAEYVVLKRHGLPVVAMVSMADLEKIEAA